MYIYWELFWSFVKVGAFCVGGGYASMPLIQAEVIENHAWMTMPQFIDIFTFIIFYKYDYYRNNHNGICRHTQYSLTECHLYVHTVWSVNYEIYIPLRIQQPGIIKLLEIQAKSSCSMSEYNCILKQRQCLSPYIASARK